jgi:uncharacterized membrane protein YbaN (DUF454 family)
MKTSTRYLFIVIGTLCVILASVGIFFPVLPTTPFLLLAAYFYARSSKRFLHWLLGNRVFGAYIDNYRSGRGITRLHKILTLLALWLSIGTSAGFMVNAWWVRVLLILIAVGVSTHILRIKTYIPEPGSQTGYQVQLDEP